MRSRSSFASTSEAFGTSIGDNLIADRELSAMIPLSLSGLKV
jgi:hypothetical protein